VRSFGAPTQASTEAAVGTQLAASAGPGSEPAPLTRPYGRKEPFLPIRLEGHVALTWEGNMGIGGRADFPLVTGTFRYSQRDELAVSVGGDVTFIDLDGSQRTEVFPSVALQWSLGVSDRFYFYPELGLVAHVVRSEWDGLFPNIGFGARYYLRRSFGLSARLGWPLALTAGVTF
jgi:hypothetical protein